MLQANHNVKWQLIPCPDDDDDDDDDPQLITPVLGWQDNNSTFTLYTTTAEQSICKICSTHYGDFYTIFQLLSNSLLHRKKLHTHTTVLIVSLSIHFPPRFTYCEGGQYFASWTPKPLFLPHKHFAAVFYIVIEHDHKVGRKL